MRHRKHHNIKTEENNNYKNKLHLKYIVIPIEVFGNKKLSYADMFLFSFIQLLDGEKGCFASNSYLANLLNTSESTITNSISKLLKLKYLTKGEFDGRKRVLKIHLDYIKNYRKKNKDSLILRGSLLSSSEADSEKLNKNENSTLLYNNKSLNKYIMFLDEWNKNKIIIHKKITSKRKQLIDKVLKLKDYTQEEIFKAFQNYAEVLHSSNHYWDKIWSMEEFLQRGLNRFVDEVDPLNNFKDYSSSNKQPNQSETKLSDSGFPLITHPYSKISVLFEDKTHHITKSTLEDWQELLEGYTKQLLKSDIWKPNYKPDKIAVFNGVVSMQGWLEKVDYSIDGGANLRYKIFPLNELIAYYILCIDDWWGGWMDGVKDNVFDVNNKIFKMFIREMETSFAVRMHINSEGWVNDSDWEPRD